MTPSSTCVVVARRSSAHRPSSSSPDKATTIVWFLPCLLATDLLVGVAFASTLRSWRRAMMTTMMTVGGTTNVMRMTPSTDESGSSSGSDVTTTRGRRRRRAPPATMGLRNGGQTCYANAVFQALSSLRPVISYLESFAVVQDEEGGEMEGGGETIESALLRTLRYANGHEVTGGGDHHHSPLPGKATRIRSMLSWLFFQSSESERDVRIIMNAVATHHPQFRTRNGLSSLSMYAAAGVHEQQDSHEFFSALMDVLSTRAAITATTTTTTTMTGVGDGDGIATCTGRRRRGGGAVGLGGIVDVVDATSVAADVCVRHERDYRVSTRERRLSADEIVEEKKHEDNDHSAMEDGEGEDEKNHSSLPPSRSYAGAIARPPSQSPPKETIARGMAVFVPSTAPGRRGRRNNPFDGWIGSTIKCASCRRVRPVRATPFLGLSLPIANVRSEFVEDCLAAEYGGFSHAELVEDVRCLSCGVMGRAGELEMEATLIDGAITSIRRRRCERMGGVDDDDDVMALVRESRLIRRKIAILGAMDPDDADDDDILDYKDDNGDSIRGIDLGIGGPNSRIVPVWGDAYRASLLMRPPEVLCIHIQRRHYDPSSGMISKVIRHVRFGERLDLSPYCAYGEASFEEEERRRILSSATSRSDCSARTIPYELMSVIEHDGNAFGGHYQTYRRVDPTGKDWVLVSDENVASRTWNEVRRCQAYMLFYVATSSKGGSP